MIKTAFTLLACGASLACLLSGAALAQSATVSTNPPAYPAGANSLSQTGSGGLRVQPQDGAGHDVSTSNPLPVTSTPSGTGTQAVAGTGTAGTPAGGVLSVQGVSGGTPAPVTIIQTGSTVIGADVVTLSGGAAITMFATNHCANGCRVSVPVTFCTNPLTTATGTATTGGNECWQANQSVAMPPTGHAISVFSTTASTASGIGSTVP